MMRIEQNLRYLREKRKKGLIIYITAGDPDLETTEKLVYTIAEAGADVIELGIPFSDPLADGVTIQQASQRALEKNANIPKILATVKKIRKKISIPLALMTYYNPVYCYGLERFTRDSQKAGVDGFIIPDLPLEESEDLRNIINKSGLALISFLAPNSTLERIKAVAQKAQGFIYCVSVTGVTGTRENFTPQILEMIEKIRLYTDIPLAIGFGISSPEQAQKIVKYADAIIVGSAIVKLIEDSQKNLPIILSQVNNFVRSLKEAIT
ncbi:MAG TPA: tryptophan synthase subunit alpha [Candidatus Atribacteria bacterium]|nr:tryptophan synthase subunit alpha [Candidatus Atribacteria bacterium]